MKIIITEQQYRILKETEEQIQNIDFNGFSEPHLLPQFGIHMVQFKSTGRFEKKPETEMFIFTDITTGKEFIFDADLVQKSGNSNFYMNLSDIRRKYNINFDEKFERHIGKLSEKETERLFYEKSKDYRSNTGYCTTNQCKDLRNVIEKSLKEIYSDNYGVYDSKYCDKTEGFLNIYPLPNSNNENGLSWSKLNYIIFENDPISLIVKSYIKQMKTFEHNDFIQWVYNNKENLFKGEFLKSLLTNISYKPTFMSKSNYEPYIKKFLPNSKVVQNFCPSTKTNYSEIVVVDNEGEKIIFQPVNAKNNGIYTLDGKYYIPFSKTVNPPKLSYKSDYILISNGPIYRNYKIIQGRRNWESPEPPVYSPTDKILTMSKKVK